MDPRPIIDAEIFGMLSVLHQSNAVQQSVLYFELSEMLESLKAGLGLFPIRDESLRRLDLNLRTRRKDGICIIEHFHPADGFWTYICDWPKGADGTEFDIEQCLNFLSEHDMQRVGSTEWLRLKREKAAQIRATNEKKADEAICNAVDSLSDKAIERFIKVEDALASGERIIAHGDDLNKLERMNQASIEAEKRAS